MHGCGNTEDLTLPAFCIDVAVRRHDTIFQVAAGAVCGVVSTEEGESLTKQFLHTQIFPEESHCFIHILLIGGVCRSVSGTAGEGIVDPVLTGKPEGFLHQPGIDHVFESDPVAGFPDESLNGTVQFVAVKFPFIVVFFIDFFIAYVAVFRKTDTLVEYLFAVITEAIGTKTCFGVEIGIGCLPGFGFPVDPVAGKFPVKAVKISGKIVCQGFDELFSAFGGHISGAVHGGCPPVFLQCFQIGAVIYIGREVIKVSCPCSWSFFHKGTQFPRTQTAAPCREVAEMSDLFHIGICKKFLEEFEVGSLVGGGLVDPGIQASFEGCFHKFCKSFIGKVCPEVGTGAVHGEHELFCHSAVDGGENNNRKSLGKFCKVARLFSAEVEGILFPGFSGGIQFHGKDGGVGIFTAYIVCRIFENITGIFLPFDSNGFLCYGSGDAIHFYFTSPPTGRIGVLHIQKTESCRQIQCEFILSIEIFYRRIQRKEERFCGVQRESPFPYKRIDTAVGTVMGTVVKDMLTQKEFFCSFFPEKSGCFQFFPLAVVKCSFHPVFPGGSGIFPVSVCFRTGKKFEGNFGVGTFCGTFHGNGGNAFHKVYFIFSCGIFVKNFTVNIYFDSGIFCSDIKNGIDCRFAQFRRKFFVGGDET